MLLAAARPPASPEPGSPRVRLPPSLNLLRPRPEHNAKVTPLEAELGLREPALAHARDHLRHTEPQILAPASARQHRRDHGVTPEANPPVTHAVERHVVE